MPQTKPRRKPRRTEPGRAATYETVFVARQPVFDSQLKTYGYALLYRDAAERERAVISDDLDATIRVVANAPLCPDTCPQDKKVFVHFPAAAILGGVPEALPPENTVILVAESETPTPELLTALRGLLRTGYTLALDGFQARAEAEPLCRLAQMICVDVLELKESRLQLLADAARAYEARLMAKRVENLQTLDMVRRMGFDLFQGFFFMKPETMAARKISASEASRLKLFEIIEKDEPDFQALAAAIEADISIAYRLFTFLNSASFSLAQPVTSIRQATVMAGWRPVRTWLRLMILTDLAPGERARELTYLSAQRARFLELGAQATGRHKDADALFLMGLFSLLEPMLNMPMERIVEHLPLPPEVKAALCGEDNEYAPWLALLQAIENTDWALVNALAGLVGLKPQQAAEAHRHSQAWADAFFGLTA